MVQSGFNTEKSFQQNLISFLHRKNTVKRRTSKGKRQQKNREEQRWAFIKNKKTNAPSKTEERIIPYFSEM
jgi:hypothetical protein